MSSPIISIKRQTNIANFVHNNNRQDSKPSPKKTSVKQCNNTNTHKWGADTEGLWVGKGTDTNPYAPIVDEDEDASVFS